MSDSILWVLVGQTGIIVAGVIVVILFNHARFQALDKRIDELRDSLIALMNEKFKAVDAKFETVDAKFVALDAKLKRLEDLMNEKFKVVDAKFEAVGVRLKGIEDRLEKPILTSKS